jgi:CBS domain-containing protein
MSLGDIVTRDVVTVQIDDTILDAARTLREEGVGSAVVVTADGEPCGVVTDRDLVVYGQNYAERLERTAVNEVMSSDLVSVPLDTDLLDLTARMREECVRRVPVVENGDLVGIVTLDDVIVRLARELGNLADVIEEESRRHA